MIKDEKNFLYKEGMFGGREAILVNPAHSDAGWTKDNLFNRSAIYDKHTGEILSLSFPKFFNANQALDLYPNPEDYYDWVIEDKLDGSLCAIDNVDGEITMRTRGAFCYTHQKNADDFKLIFEKYPKVMDMVTNDTDCTYIFEIITPNNRIVLQYDEVDFVFIGCIDKKHKMLHNSGYLNYMADIYGLKRPKKYDFKSLSDVAAIVKEWRDKEGVVISYNNDQNKVKLKADRYNFLHRILTGVRSTNDILDKFFELGCPMYNAFYKYYETEYDYEIAEELKDSLLKVDWSYLIYCMKHLGIKCFIWNGVDKVSSRKDKALKIIEEYGDRPLLKSLAFNTLDGRSVDNKLVRKIMKQSLEDEK